MRAVIFDQSRPAVVEQAMPTPKGADLLVRVAASSINGTDRGLRRGGVFALVARGTRPGFDLSGTVVACGPRVTAFDVGDRVMALLDHGGGGQAEYVLVPQTRAAAVPAGVSDIEAAALPLAGLTALQALRCRGGLHLRRRGRLLVNGAAGGIGSFAVQLGRLYDAETTGVADAARAGYVSELGADDVVDRDDLVARKSNGPFDLVFDVPGRLRFTDAASLLRPDGVLVTTRPVSADALRLLWRGGRDRHGRRFAAVTTAASPQDLAYLARLVERGEIRVPIDKSFPLEDAGAAYDHADSGRLTGKVVLTV